MRSRGFFVVVVSEYPSTEKNTMKGIKHFAYKEVQKLFVILGLIPKPDALSLV